MSRKNNRNTASNAVIRPEDLGSYAQEKLELYNTLGTRDPMEIFHKLRELYANHGLEIRNQLPLNPVGKKIPTSDKLTDRLVRRATAARDDWKEASLNPSRSAVEAAISAKDKYVDRLEKAIKEGRWESGLALAGEETRLAILRETDPAEYSEGLEKRRAKIKKVFDTLQPQFQAVSDAIQAMPDKTDADREKRLTQARRLMLQVSKKRS